MIDIDKWPYNLIHDIECFYTYTSIDKLFINPFILTQCIDTLSYIEKDIIYSTYKDGIKLIDIAKKHNISAPKASTYKNKALCKLNAEKINFTICKDNKMCSCYNSIIKLGLSARTYNVLKRNGIHTLNDFDDNKIRIFDLKNTYGLGSKSTNEILDAIYNYHDTLYDGFGVYQRILARSKEE